MSNEHQKLSSRFAVDNINRIRLKVFFLANRKYFPEIELNFIEQIAEQSSFLSFRL
jgi:hypothetical protein